MPYGILKIDTITFTDGGVDKSVPVSGLVLNPTFTGNVTVTGTISGNIIQGGTTVSGLTVTGTTANFASGVFTTRVSGLLITGPTVSATTGTFTSLTGTTTTGTTANFASGVFTTQISGVTITGTTVSTTTGNFTSLTGTTATFTSGIIASGTAALPSLAILSDPNTGIYSPGADQLAVATNGTQRLTVDTAATTSTLPVVHPLGAVGTPSITFTGDLNTGFYSPAADTLAAVTAGSNRLHITSGGFVGIGTSAPSQLLTLVSTNATNLYLQRTGVPDGNSSDTAAIEFANVTGAVAEFRCGGDGDLQIKTKALSTDTYNNSLFITGSTGRVGIGTTSPGSALEINAAAATSPFIAKINTTEAARIDSSGRLLVGTSSATVSCNSVFQGNSGSSTGAGILYAQRGSANPGAGTLGVIRFSDSNQSIGAEISGLSESQWASGDYPGVLVFSTTANGASSPTEGLRIDASQVVWLSNSFLSAANFATTGRARIANAAGTNTGSVGMESYGSSTATRHHISFSNPNGVVGSISTNASATAYNTSSDYRLKENFTPVTDGITRLQQLKPSRFNFIADPDTEVDGFIAHEVQTVVPEAITGEKDAVDADGNPVYQGIDQSKLVPLLTAALQEAIAKIESLEARLTAAGI